MATPQHAHSFSVFVFLSARLNSQKYRNINRENKKNTQTTKNVFGLFEWNCDIVIVYCFCRLVDLDSLVIIYKVITKTNLVNNQMLVIMIVETNVDLLNETYQLFLNVTTRYDSIIKEKLNKTETPKRKRWRINLKILLLLKILSHKHRFGLLNSSIHRLLDNFNDTWISKRFIH